jgi:lipopolysaccharide export system permease protein
MLPDLLDPDAAMLADGRISRGQYIAEAHDKLSLPLLGMVFPALALAALVSGPFRRGGMGWKIAGAAGGAALVQILALGVIGQIGENPALAPLAYLPAALALIATLVLLLRAGRLAGPARRP